MAGRLEKNTGKDGAMFLQAPSRVGEFSTGQSFNRCVRNHPSSRRELVMGEDMSSNVLMRFSKIESRTLCKVAPEIHRWIRLASLTQRTVS